MRYDNKPDNTWEDHYYAQAFPEESSLQRGGDVPLARSVMLSLKEICLEYWIGSIAR